MANPNDNALWYFSVNGQACGPVALRMLQQMARAGHLQPDCLVWNNAHFDRVRADSLTFLFPSRQTSGDGSARQPGHEPHDSPDPSLGKTAPAGREAWTGDDPAGRPKDTGDQATPPGARRRRRMPSHSANASVLYPPRDRRLVDECIAGQPEAWNSFVDQFAPLAAFVIDRTAAHMRTTLTAADREYLLTEALVTISSCDAAILRSFRGKATLDTYLMIVVRRCVVEELAKPPELRLHHTARGVADPVGISPRNRDEKPSIAIVPAAAITASVLPPRETYVKGVLFMLACLSVAALLGQTIGGTPLHPLTAISGTVAYHDGTPLPVPSFRLKFHPLARPALAEKKPPLGHAAVEGETGAFSQATTNTEGDGVALGLCRVTIHNRDGGVLPTHVIDDRYHFVRSTPLIVDTRRRPLKILVDPPSQR